MAWRSDAECALVLCCSEQSLRVAQIVSQTLLEILTMAALVYVSFQEASVKAKEKYKRTEDRFYRIGQFSSHVTH